MKNKLTNEELIKVQELQTKYKTVYKQRDGQAFFNALYFLFPNTADEIRNTEFDTFYMDKNIDKCIKRIVGE
jgi:hypothetical protein